MSRGPRYDKADVLARVDLLRLAVELGGKPRSGQHGAEVCMPCFLHGGHGDNLKVSKGKGLWHCWTGCDAGGNAIDLVMRAHGLDFATALAWLGDHVGARPQGAGEHWRSRPRPTPQRAPQRPSVSPHAPVLGRPPCAARLRVLGALWAILEDAPLGADSVDYLEHRLPSDGGSGPDIARALGCRDWSTRAGKICALLESTTTEDLHAAGLARADGRLWTPLRALQSHATGITQGSGGQWGSQRMAGIGVPVWWPGAPAPMAWRWRYLRPLEQTDRKHALKSQAMFTVGDDTPPAVLGLRTPARTIDAPWLPPLTDAPALVIAEGEPDWWSLTMAAAELPADVRPAVVAVASGGWRMEWAPLLLRSGKPRPVLVTAHASETGDKTAKGVRAALVASVGLAEARRVYSRWPIAEDCDANDTQQRAGLGSLVATLKEWAA